MCDGIDKPILLFITVNLPNKEDRIENDACNNQNTEQHTQDQQDPRVIKKAIDFRCPPNGML